jgi:hypothetical protein
MLETPFRFEPNFTTEEWQKLGQLMLRWSHTEHVIGNCLKVMLRLSDAEAVIMVFPLGLEQRIQRISDLSELAPFKGDAKAAYDELCRAIKAIQYVRSNVAHAVVVEDDDGGYHFELRSKGRKLSKSEILSAEEITNYAAHAAYSFRVALGQKEYPGARHPLPDRPSIPKFLRSFFAERKPRKRATHRSRQRSSRKKYQPRHDVESP